MIQYLIRIVIVSYNDHPFIVTVILLPVPDSRRDDSAAWSSWRKRTSWTGALGPTWAVHTSGAGCGPPSVCRSSLSYQILSKYFAAFFKSGRPRTLFRLFLTSFSSISCLFFKPTIAIFTKHYWKNIRLIYGSEIWTHNLLIEFPPITTT